METMHKDFDGLVAAGTSAEVPEVSRGCNSAKAKRLYRWKCDLNGMEENEKAGMIVWATAK